MCFGARDRYEHVDCVVQEVRDGDESVLCRTYRQCVFNFIASSVMKSLMPQKRQLLLDRMYRRSNTTE